MDTGLLLVRVIVGLLFAGHGVQKLSHRFGGHGVDGTAVFYRQLGFRPAKLMAAVAGVTELTSGLLLASGLLTPFAGAGIIGVMIVAAWVVNRPNGLWIPRGGYEYDLVLATVGATLAFTGPGTVSLDHVLDWNLAGVGWGVLAIATGLATAVIVLLGREQTPAPTEDADELDLATREPVDA